METQIALYLIVLLLAAHLEVLGANATNLPISKRLIRVLSFGSALIVLVSTAWWLWIEFVP